MKKVTKVLTGAVSSVGAMAVAAMPVLAAELKAPGWSNVFGGNLGGIINFALNVVFGIAVLIALFYLIWGAFSWITSSGEQAKTAAARQKIVAAVVGLILIAATWAILNIVLQIIGLGTVEQTINNYLLNPASN